MDKQHFLRLSIPSIILQIITVSLAISCFYYSGFFIYAIIKTHGEVPPLWVALLAAIILFLGGIVFCYIESTFYVGSIFLSKHRIATHGDNRIGKSKLQLPAYVRYVDIQDIRISALEKKFALFLRPIPYLVVTTKKGEEVRFALHFMKESTVKAMIVELYERCEAMNNFLSVDIDELMNNFSKATWAHEKF